jgi:hypothetical protein
MPGADRRGLNRGISIKVCAKSKAAAKIPQLLGYFRLLKKRSTVQGGK